MRIKKNEFLILSIMRKYSKTVLLVFIFTLLWLVSCKENTSADGENAIANNTAVANKTKAQKLADVVFKEGAIISAVSAPKVIKADDVYKSLNKNILAIDIRGAKDFASGHIKNAVNIKMSEVVDYAQATGFPMYDKVVMICYTGQTASFSAAVLQMLGHDNVYVLEWGMCGWNKKFSKKWITNISDKGIDKLVTTPYEKNAISELPLLVNKKNTGEQILYLRAREILKEGFASAAVNFSYTNANAKADKAYVVCYQPEAMYKEGHIDHAVLYSQEDSFNLSTDLLTLPTDKTIIVYSNKAYQSTFITVYLKMLGYNARTLKFGANSFMNSKLKDSGEAFSERVIKNYPYETSKYIEVVGEVQEGGC